MKSAIELQCRVSKGVPALAQTKITASALACP
jgi:hypothetical protein